MKHNVTPFPYCEKMALIVLDGFGMSDDVEHNAIAQAHTPYFQHLKRIGLFGRLDANGSAVGLPEGQLSGSEVGHMVIGAGRVIPTMVETIDLALKNGSMAHNNTLRNFIARVVENNGTLHIAGLTSEAGVHSKLSHGISLAHFAHSQGIQKIAWHAFTDGRDSPPESAYEFLLRVENALSTYGGSIATVCGRAFAMDRNENWENTELAFRLIIEGKGERVSGWQEALKRTYALQKSDEFVAPSVLPNFTSWGTEDGIIFFNFRADRMRQLASRFLRGEMAPGPRCILSMVSYADDLEGIDVVFSQSIPTLTLGECISRAGKTQLRAAETEKYPHVTFFFNGGYEGIFPGEIRLSIPSPSVPHYDLQPEMSSQKLTQAVMDKINKTNIDCLIINYANADMVGHTGNLKATIRAIETLDQQLHVLLPFLWERGFGVIITADHGNAEDMFDEVNASQHTAHTFNDVPICVTVPYPELLEGWKLKTKGTLADCAPTLLTFMKIPIPPEMKGECLVVAENS